MTNNPSIHANSRTLLGRKVKNLRQQGLVPANVYGYGTDSVAIEVNQIEFSKLYQDAGETGVVDLKVGDEKRARPVLISSLQFDPVTGAILHIDFLQVDLTKTIATNVPLVLEGESAAVKEKDGVLVQVINEVEVEALPDDLPDHLTLDLSLLAEIGDSLKVSDLKAPAGVTLLDDPETVLVTIQEQVEEVEVEAAPVEEDEAAEAPAEEEAPAE
jgi:large subunit ribosomal protein L25